MSHLILSVLLSFMLLWNVHLGFAELQFGSGDGRIFTISKQQAKFHEARTACRNEGKKLATITNRYNITREIEKFMRKNKSKENVHYVCKKATIIVLISNDSSGIR